MSKAKSKKKSALIRHDPLGSQVTRERPFRAARTVQRDDGAEKEDDDQLPDDLGTRILKQSSAQRVEDLHARLRRPRTWGEESKQLDDGMEGGEEDGEEERDEENDFDDNVEDEEYVSGEEDIVEIDEQHGFVAGAGLTEAEERVVNSFLFGGSEQKRTLADIIQEKIVEKQREQEAHGTVEPGLPPKVVEVYTSLGRMLSTYRAGKLPKALKMLPNLKSWEQILWLTRPDDWSPHSVYACTRIFASNLNAKMAQRFYNMVLLERCRDDIRTNKKLNYHLYMALKKALYKPSAFYKGILLPLAQSGTCTLREATIFGSVIAKVSIPGTHSAAVLLMLVQMPYSGCNSLFIRILLNKKYALPLRVISSLVSHFCGFENETRQLPVLWHHALLVFAQRYKHQLNPEERERLKQLLKIQTHYQITPEIRRELLSTDVSKPDAMVMA